MRQIIESRKKSNNLTKLPYLWRKNKEKVNDQLGKEVDKEQCYFKLLFVQKSCPIKKDNKICLEVS